MTATTAIPPVEGWLFGNAASITSDLLREQTRRGIYGDVLEIGVYHGKFLIVLANNTTPGERTVALDIFESDVPTDLNCWGNRDIFLANMHTYAPDCDLVVIEANSMALDAEATRTLDAGKYRCISIDGCHEYAAALSDLWLAQRLILPGGLVIMDDWGNTQWPGVSKALIAYEAQGGRLVRSSAGITNKMVLATDDEWAMIYGRVIGAAL